MKTNTWCNWFTQQCGIFIISVTWPKKLLNLLSAHLAKWSDTLKQFVGNSRRIVWVYLFVGLVLKGLRFSLDESSQWISNYGKKTIALFRILFTNIKKMFWRIFFFQHQKYTSNYGSSHRRCSVKKGVLKNFGNFTGKPEGLQLY